jgi:hypothetical protein
MEHVAPWSNLVRVCRKPPGVTGEDGFPPTNALIVSRSGTDVFEVDAAGTRPARTRAAGRVA